MATATTVKLTAKQEADFKEIWVRISRTGKAFREYNALQAKLKDMGYIDNQQKITLTPEGREYGQQRGWYTDVYAGIGEMFTEGLRYLRQQQDEADGVAGLGYFLRLLPTLVLLEKLRNLTGFTGYMWAEYDEYFNYWRVKFFVNAPSDQHFNWDANVEVEGKRNFHTRTVTYEIDAHGFKDATPEYAQAYASLIIAAAQVCRILQQDRDFLGWRAK